MADRFPNYDVLAKRDTLSWNEQTREAIEARLGLSDQVDVLSPNQRVTLRVIADRIVPQPEHRPAVNTVAILLDKIGRDASDGFRPAGLPRIREAWERGLDGLEAEAQARHNKGLTALDGGAIDTLLGCVEKGEVQTDWRGIDPQLFWQWRLIPDLIGAYYAHPSAWSAIGFGGPASPRGYVRLDTNRRDPWEATEADRPTLSGAERNCHAR